MSNRAITWAYEQDLASGAKFVLVALADGASNEDYTCYPGQETLARMTGQGARSVRRHLAELEAAGLIVRERRNRKNGSRTSDRYTLKVGDPAWPDCPVKDDHSDLQVAETNRPKWPLGSAAYRPNCPNLPATMAGPEPLEETNQLTPLADASGAPPRGGAPPALVVENRRHADDGRRKAEDASKRKTRLDPGWQPTARDRDYAQGRGFSEAEVDDIADNFYTYFTAGPGSATAWVRWSGANGAWGTWVRREIPRSGRGLGNYDAGRGRRRNGSVVAAVDLLLDQC